MLDIYVINLDRRRDRLLAMTEKLAALELSFERVRAVDGLGDADIGFSDDHPRLTKPEYACYLSHVECWRRLIDSNAERCLILEDDVHLSPNIGDVLNRDVLFSHDFGVTRLETLGSRCYLAVRPLFQSGPYNVRRSVTYQGGTGAYVISRAHALKLLETQATPHISVDDLIYDERQDVFGRPFIAQVVPGMAIQDIYFPPGKTDDRKNSDMIEIREANRLILAAKMPVWRRSARLFKTAIYRIFKRVGFRKETVIFDQ